MAKPGRPTKYSAEVADSICERLMQGESLLSICRDESMPGKTAVFNWLARYQEFADKYARAKATQADYMAEEILEIADDAERDYTEGGQFNGENVQRARLRVDTRKWLMSKLQPKKYSERHQVEHSGSIGRDLNTLTDEELAAIATGSADTSEPAKGESQIH